jgi:hypothetical protein
MTSDYQPDEVPNPSPVEDSEVATTPTSKTPWLWLVAGLLAAIAVPIATNIILASFQAPLPAEYDQLSAIEAGGGSLSEEQSASLKSMVDTNARGNVMLFLFGNGMLVAAIFGIFAGVISGRIGLGIVGAVVGVGSMYLIATLGAPTVVDLQRSALADLTSGDTTAMGMHALQWVLMGAASFIAVAIGFRSPTVGAKFLGAAILGAILGGVLYVLGATILDHNNQTGTAEPTEGTARYLWTSLVPVLTGFFMARTKQV